MSADQLAMQMAAVGLPTPVKEHRFHEKRRWRFDFAWPDRKVAVEYEGLGRGKSRHTTITGYSGDCEKYNEAQALGWRVFRFTTLHVRNGSAAALLERFFDERT